MARSPMSLPKRAPVAEAIVRAVHAVDPQLAILAISGTVLEQVARARGLAVFSEIFADRGYTPAGLLVPRSDARRDDP